MTAEGAIRTPDQRIRVFVSSTMVELAAERQAVRAAVERLHLTPVMFELGARPHPPRELYRAYLEQSHVFVGVYHERYGWVPPDGEVSGLEEEFRLSEGIPQLLYVKRAVGPVEPRLRALLDTIRRDATASYRVFDGPDELAGLVEEDLSALLSERFMIARADAEETSPVARDRANAPPVPLTPTVGRERDVQRIVELLDAGVRLLTITGPGGVGKSRLALEVARAVADRFADGVVFVPLEELEDAGDVLRNVASAVGAPDAGTRPVFEALADELADQHVLLLVDNMEQVVAAGPDLAALLGRCPGVSALVTSRHLLRLRAETAYQLAPLLVPPENLHADLADVPAVDLFVQRATAAAPGFRLDETNRATVAEVVRLLDGLPLAIELAAARTRLLPPAALLERLTGRLDVLADGAGDLPPRQRTLRATIDWSYELLEPSEQVLLARMSVFVGGATLDAVEAVCGDQDVPDVLGTVSSLVAKSLLAPSGSAADPRTSMLRMIRSRAADLLAERGEAVATAARHARWYADLAEVGDVLRHDDAPGHWPLLQRETHNLRASAQWALGASDPALIVDLARGLWPWLWSSGRVGELLDAATRVQGAMPEAASPQQRGYLHYVASYAQGLTGDLTRGLHSIEQALEELDRVSDAETELLVAAARLVRGTLRVGLGRDDGVGADMDVAVTTARSTPNCWLLGYATSHRGLRRAMEGDLVGAREDHEESLAVARVMGHEVLVAQAVGQLAMVDVLEGRLDDARAHLGLQVDRLRRSRHLEGLANALDTAAALAVAEQRWESSARSAAAAQALRVRIRLAPWPLIREYHESSVAAAHRQLGDRLVRLTAEAARADPWSVVRDALIAL